MHVTIIMIVQCIILMANSGKTKVHNTLIGVKAAVNDDMICV